MTETNPTAPPGGMARPLAGWRLLLYAILPVLFVIGVGLRLNATRLRDGQAIDGDTYMRLLQLRESLAAGHLLNIMPRDASGAGFVLHWSHLFDAILWLAALPLRLFLPYDQAVMLVAQITGPVEIAGFAVAVTWAASPFVSRELLWLVAILATLPTATFSYGLPGIAHHHIVALILAVLAIGQATRVLTDQGPEPSRRPGYAGWVIGCATGIGVWFTPETLPLTVSAFGLLYVGWLTMPLPADMGPSGMRPSGMRPSGMSPSGMSPSGMSPSGRVAVALRDAGFGFLAIVTFALIIDPPAGGFGALDVDRVSALFLGVALVAAMMGVGVVRIDRRVSCRSRRLTFSLAWLFGLTAIWLACALAWLRVFTGEQFGPYQALGSTELRVMHAVISELQPIRDVRAVLAHLFPGIVGVVALAVLAVMHRSVLLAAAALMGGVALGFAATAIRFVPYPATLGAVMLLVVLTRIVQARPLWPEWRRAALRIAAILVFVVVPFGALVLEMKQRTTEAQAGTFPTCSVTHLGPMLAPYAEQVVLSNVNDVPELLYRTQIATVGSLYMRNAAPFGRLRDAWRSLPAASVPDPITAAGIRYVLFCPTSERSALVADLPPETLLDRLGKGDIPAWLHEIARDADSGNVLYAVVAPRD